MYARDETITNRSDVLWTRRSLATMTGIGEWQPSADETSRKFNVYRCRPMDARTLIKLKIDVSNNNTIF